MDFVELIVPESQARGLFRHDYGGATLREQAVMPNAVEAARQDVQQDGADSRV